MDIKSAQKTISLLYRIVGAREPDKKIECVPYYPQKLKAAERLPAAQPFARAIPETQGIDSDLLADFLDDIIANQRELCTHNIMILRNSKVIAECAFHPFEKDIWHVTHSMCKSITGLAIGILIDEGKLSLDTRLIDIFPDKVGSITAIRKKELTIYQLLTMSSGISLNEAGSVTEENWLKAYFESPQLFKPGTDFHYNSMNSYVLAEIVRAVSGKNLSEFLDEKLFGPLGITNYYWEKSPNGTDKGGWGLYILAEDLAKIGQMIVNGGLWNGQRIISQEYLAQATSKQIRSAEHMNDYGYGFQIWVSKRSGASQFNGMLGQNVFMIPDLNMVIVVSAGNREMAPKSLMSELVTKYFGDGFRPKQTLPENPAAYERLSGILREIESPHLLPCDPLPKETAYLDGVRYHMYTRNTLFLPLFIQGMQNNHSKGITEVGFSVEDGVFMLHIHEHEDEYHLPIGFGEYRESVLDFAGEQYLVKAAGAFTTDEDGNLVLKLHIPFVETANARFVKFYFMNGGKKLRAAWDETPPIDNLSDIDKIISAGSGALVTSVVQKAADTESDVLNYMIQRSISPIGFGECITELPKALPARVSTFLPGF